MRSIRQLNPERFQHEIESRLIKRMGWVIPLFILSLLLLSFYTEVSAKENAPVDESAKLRIQETYGKLPLYFIKNDGQVDEKVKFYEKGSGHATYFMKEGVYITLVRGDKGDMTSQLIKLTFLNANPNPEIIAADQQEGKVNYFIGNDPKKWRTNVPTYRAVLYKEVYPGIDIKFYGNNRQMEYDIIVKPGADPSKVQLAYDGIEDLRITENGDLEITLHPPSSKLTQKSPIIYQEIDGKRIEVEGRFKILGNHVIASEAKKSSSPIPSPLGGEGKGEGEFAYTFELASYDKAHPLVIDPVLVYATYLGGSGDESGVGIAVDAEGNTYVSGWTTSSDFPATPGSYDTTFNGGNVDAFVVKLNAAGSFLSYATYLGGSSSDTGHRIAVDAAGNVYVSGETDSSDFPATPGAYDTTYNGGNDVFVVKLEATGSLLSYATYIGGSSYESGAEDMTVDAAGNAYVTGYTVSSDFPTIPGVYDATFNGGGDAFVAKVNTAGSLLTYSTYLGGSSTDIGYHIAVDVAGNTYVTGETWSSDFPATSGAYDTIFNGAPDVFVARFDATGSILSYATYLGGNSDESGGSIVVDSSGNAYVAGITRSSDFPTTPGAYDTTFNGGIWDSFVVKLNPAGSLLFYSTYIGGSNGDGGNIAMDAAGNVYVGGGTDSSDFPTTPGAYDTTYNGNGDVFVAKLNAAGSLLTYSTYIGGSNFESGSDIIRDADGNIYVTGWTNSLDFPATAGAYDTTYNGGRDIFVVKINFPIDLPRTGQTTCYDLAGAVIPCAGTGQDGEIQAGVPWPDPRFTDNGDGTVTDNLTGLMWTQDGNAPGPVACSPATTKTWQGALDYVACLNTNSYLGYTDWRLPNVNELESLVNVEQLNIATWLNTQGVSNVQPDYYWSSTSTAVYLDAASWIVNIGNGTMFVLNKFGYYYVWPVRSGQSGVAQLWETGQTTCYDSAGNVITCTGTGQDGETQAGVPWPSPRFTDYGDGTVTDNLTGLMWTKNANLPGTYMTWQQALDYVNGMNAGTYPNYGYTDWRLPNRKEPHSLTDFSRYSPALPSGYPFTNVQSDYYWLSTSFASPPYYAWIVNMWSGYIAANIKSNFNYYVWPVRSGQVGAIGSTEICDGIDNDLDGFIDEGFTDTDSDGQADCVDSDDDNDGYSDTAEIAAGSDPLNAASTPEVCDGVDNDLDGQTDEGLTITYYQDSDNDTYGNLSISIEACSLLSGYVLNNTDCNDNNSSIHPSATENCNGVDDNCNGHIDEGVQDTFYQDNDNDTYGNAFVTALSCIAPLGYVSDSTDCNDNNAAINPGATEVCNGIDDNCDGQVDEEVQNIYYQDADSDTYGNPSVTTQACTLPSGYVSNSTDCNDSNANIHPGAPEVPNDGIDQDCNGIDLAIEAPVSQASGVQQTQTVAWNDMDNEYLVLWQDFRNGAANPDIYGARLDRNGNVVAGNLPVITQSAKQAGPWAAYGGGGYAAVWIDQRNISTTGTDVYGAWILPDGTVSSEFVVTNALSNQRAASVVYNPSANNFLVTWIDETNGTSNIDVSGAIVNPGGGVSGSPFAMVTATGNQRGPYVRYDYGNSQYFMVWFDNRGGNYDIYGSRVSSSGALLDGSGLVISNATGDQKNARMTDRRPADGVSNFVLSWIDFRNGQADIYGALIDEYGTKTGSDIQIAGGSYDQRAASIDVDYVRTKQAVVSWIDNRNGTDFDIYRAQVDQSGVVSGAALVAGAATGAANNQQGPLSFYTADGGVDNGFLMLWRDNRSGVDYDLYGIKVWP